MKMKNMLLFFSLLFCAITSAQKNIIELPITLQNGYGPFSPGFSGIGTNSNEENNPWKKTYVKCIGIPTTWTDTKQGAIETNIQQTVYQNYLSGNITPEFYTEFKKSSNWSVDTLNLSKKPIKCKIAFATGKNATGVTEMVVDANNNHDFSDDVIFKPADYNEQDPNSKINFDSICSKTTIIVSYERFSKNKIVWEKVPLFILHMTGRDIYMCNFPQYATTRLDGKELAICFNNFMSVTYKTPSITLLNDSLKIGKKANNEDIVSVNEYIKIKDNVYKNIGVNPNKNTLVLEKINKDRNQLCSSQIGFKTFAFEGQNFKTKSSISLNDYKGKYLLIDFWSVYCVPCIQEFANLKEIYNKTDKSKFEIIGIVGDSPLDELEKRIDKYSVTWPQIVSDEKNKIKETYGVSGYPTTFLINPDGIIVGKNLRGKNLANKIDELIK